MIVTSPLLFQSYLTHLLLSFFLPAVLSLFLLCMLSWFRTGDVRQLLHLFSIGFFGSFLFAGIPWIVPTIPFIAVVLYNSRDLIRGSLHRRLFLGGLAVALGGAWSVPAVFEMFFGGNSWIQATLSKEDLAEEIDVIQRDVPSNLVRTIRQMPIDQVWRRLSPDWSRYISFVSMIFLVIVVLIAMGSTVNWMKQSRRISVSVLICSFALLVSIILVSPGSIPFTRAVFEWTVLELPGLGALRNYYDKAVLGFLLALTMFLVLLIRSCAPRVKQWLRTGWIVVAVLISVPTILGVQLDSRFTVGFTKLGLNAPNDDYRELTQWIRANLEPDSKVLQLPLSRGNWSHIEDRLDPNLWYIGVSPFRYLTSRADLKGIAPASEFGFETENVATVFGSKDFSLEQIESIAFRLGISGIILTKGIRGPKSDLVLNDIDLLKIRNLFKSESITDFGERYTYISLPSQFASKFVLAHEVQSCDDLIHQDQSEVDARQSSVDHFQVEFKSGAEQRTLLMKLPYDKQWRMKLPSGEIRRSSESEICPGWSEWDFYNGDFRAWQERVTVSIFRESRIPLSNQPSTLWTSWAIFQIVAYAALALRKPARTICRIKTTNKRDAT
jgi:hypothetical protein